MPRLKLTTNTRSKRCGAARSKAVAVNGPSIAPAASMARWTPKAEPRPAGGVLSEIRASRGAVRIPLPMRSAVTVAMIPVTWPPTRSQTTRLIAEMP